MQPNTPGFLLRPVIQSCAAIAVNYRENEAGAATVVNAIMARGCTAFAIEGDVAVVTSIYRMFDETESKLSNLDIVVSNVATVINKPTCETKHWELQGLLP